jgi:hypothetical protein
VPLVKDSSSSLLNLGTIKPVDDLTLKAQQEGPSQDAKPYSCLTLTKEERAAEFAATKMANPDANREDFELAYKIALWKADSQKKGINPGSNTDAVDFLILLYQTVKMAVEKNQTPLKIGSKTLGMTYKGKDRSLPPHPQRKMHI